MLRVSLSVPETPTTVVTGDVDVLVNDARHHHAPLGVHGFHAGDVHREVFADGNNLVVDDKDVGGAQMFGRVNVRVFNENGCHKNL